MADIEAPEPHHPELAEYVLGALDTAEAAAFEAHLASCASCRAEVDELRPVAALLDVDVPDVGLPEDLRARALAAVASTRRDFELAVEGGRTIPAVVADLASARARRDTPGRRLGRPWKWGIAAMAAAIVVVLGLAVLPMDRGGEAQFALGASGGSLTIEKTPSGWRIDLSAELARRDDGEYYEAFVEGPDDRVSVGTFNDGDEVVLWSGVPLRVFNEFLIVAQPGGTEVDRARLDL